MWLILPKEYEFNYYAWKSLTKFQQANKICVLLGSGESTEFATTLNNIGYSLIKQKKNKIKAREYLLKAK